MCATVYQSLHHPDPQRFGDDSIKKIFVPLKSRFFIEGNPRSERISQREQKDQTNSENISVAPGKSEKMCCPTIRSGP